MDLYTLNENFLPHEEVDEYVSAIWTERYSAAGEFELLVPESTVARAKLIEGTKIGLVGTKEVMTIDTVSIEDKMMKIVGSALPYFLNQRYAWFTNPESSDADGRIQDYTSDSKKPGEFISYVVEQMVINPTPFTSGYAAANLQWDDEVIEFLELGDIDTSGEVKTLTAPIGPLYDSVQQIADKEHVGISLYLHSADPDTGYVLKFKTYQGVDHTTGSGNQLIRLVPNLDSLSNVKELRSISTWKNVCYVYYQGGVTVHYEDPDNIPVGFDRRVLVTNAEDEPVGHKPNPITRPTLLYAAGGKAASPPPASTATAYADRPYFVGTAPQITAFREQNAKDALANHNYIRAIDGETSPQNDYVFGVDYGLGDIIELEGLTGLISKARITEYIRSEDAAGHKEYPTISVLGQEGGG